MKVRKNRVNCLTSFFSVKMKMNEIFDNTTPIFINYYPNSVSFKYSLYGCFGTRDNTKQTEQLSDKLCLEIKQYLDSLNMIDYKITPAYNEKYKYYSGEIIINMPYKWFEENERYAPIYTITGISLNPIITTHAIKESRCFGFYHDLETAKEEVVHNTADINEGGTIEYAVIERVYPGPYNVDSNCELWYSFNNKTEQYEPCEKPICLKQICHFGIG